ncbi:hypothetical protein [Serratia quinivorans]|uniref:hypothetical protein n=1 Tax=Serratia quinivorans TaxID=137545 RepID=UPI003F964B3C
MPATSLPPRLRVVVMMEPGLVREGTLKVLEFTQQAIASLTVVDDLLTLRQVLSQDAADVILTGLTGHRDRLRDFFLFYSHYLRFNIDTTWLLYSEPLTPLLTTLSPLMPSEGPLCLPHDLQPHQLHDLLLKRQTLGHPAFMAQDLSCWTPSDIVLSWPELQVLSHFVCDALEHLTTSAGGFTTKTLSAHKRSAMRKLGVHCDQELHALLHGSRLCPTRRLPDVALSQG